ncbi:MAG TPA: hypothetical protein PL029_05355 [Bacteroidia bacterium]|nr:hypothetical protein [Bacteroidia bacterium]
MKQLRLIFILFLTATGFSAQTNTATPQVSSNVPNDPQTPNTITNRFNADYPNSHPTWDRSGANYRAKYNMGTLKRTIVYDVNGRVVSREEELTSDAFPLPVVEYYNRKFPGEQATVFLKTDLDGNKIYYAEHGADTYWFDKSGKYKKKTRNMPQESNPKANATGTQ